MAFNSSKIKRIAIIGAGPSGLATAKYLLAENAFTEIVIFEQRDTVGGTWNYTPLPPDQKIEKSPCINGHMASKATEVITANLSKFNTPMYDGLESNLPHMLMQFSDARFPEGTQLFAEREIVMQYLEEYASDIRPLIRFNHQVLDLTPFHEDKDSDKEQKWEVSFTASSDGPSQKATFDAVAVANGHCDWPLLPSIEGLDAWCAMDPESFHHSVSYKNPKAFKGKRVLLVGGGPSGADIERHLGSVCQHPLLVATVEESPYRTEETFTRNFPALVGLIPKERAARFADGSIERDIDAILWCTGYGYRFLFLTSIHPNIGGEGLRALPLYQHIFHADYPTLAFVEVPEKIVPFPFAESQAAVVARVWSNRLPLPSPKDMSGWLEKNAHERGAGRKAHILTPPTDVDYMNEMFAWSSEAEKLPDGSSGKMSIHMDSKLRWLRLEAAEMRKAFNAKGEGRHHILTYEELGFSYDKGAIN